MLTGLVAAGHVHLTAIARGLTRGTGNIHAIEKRLSGHLGIDHWDMSPVADGLLRKSAAAVGDDTLIVADLTDAPISTPTTMKKRRNPAINNREGLNWCSFTSGSHGGGQRQPSSGLRRNETRPVAKTRCSAAERRLSSAATPDLSGHGELFRIPGHVGKRHIQARTGG
jgi:hypothetical protein